MPVRKLTPDTWQKALRRVLIVGPPNSRKTTSFLTWPRPLHVLVAPGEKGHASLPVDREDVHAYVFEHDSTTKISPAALVREFEQTAFEILGGKHGDVTTFAVDGLHKAFDLYLNEASDGKLFDGEKVEPRDYGPAGNKFADFLNRVMLSPVPYAIFSCWDGREKDDPDSKGTDAPQHIFPDLPGKAAKRIMGEFSVVLHASVSNPVPGIPQKATWQLIPGGKVWGCGVKIPVEIAAKLPQKVEQDWAKLEPLLLGQVTSKEAA